MTDDPPPKRSIRAAGPADAAALAPLVYAAGRTLHDHSLSLGSLRPLDVVREALREPAGVLGHGHLRVAVVDGEVVGCVGRHPGELTPRLFRQTAHKAWRMMSWRQVATFAARSLALVPMQRDAPPRRLMMAHCAVRPDWRGRGVFRALFDEVLREAVQGPYDAIRLEVAVDNTGAVAVYRRLGFEAVARVPGVRGLPDVQIMERAVRGRSSPTVR